MNDIKIPWPDWKTVRRIGNGSCGSVYEIERDDRFGNTEKAALKVISIPKEESELEYLMDSGYDDMSLTVEYEQRLERIVNEYVLLSQLKGHPNILSVEDRKAVQQENGIGWDVYIRMELLTSLVKAIRNKEVSEEEVRKIGISIARALISCHEMNIIHRDVKPGNIFVSRFGEYKLGDFGVAKVMTHTTSATMTGTPDYMAPEVYKNEKYGREADIYSLGLVLYWLLNNRRMPFEPTDPKKPPTMMQREEAYKKRMDGSEEIPEPVHGDDELKRIVIKALSYKPSDRYRNAADLLEDLESVRKTAVQVHSNDMSSSEISINQEDSQKPEISSVQTGDQTIGAGWMENNRRPETPVKSVEIPKIDSKTTAPVKDWEDGNRTMGAGWYGQNSRQRLTPPADRVPAYSADKRNTSYAGVSRSIAVPQRIVPLSVSFYQTLGLRDNGTVTKAGVNVHPQFNISDWHDIIAVSAGLNHSLGLKSDGTVVATGLNRSGQCNVSNWKDIAAVYCTNIASFGLKTDGTVICTSEVFRGVTEWQGITALAVNSDHIVGLREDGTVIAAGNNSDGQCNVAGWTNIIAVAVGIRHTVGLKADGTVTATGSDESSQCTKVQMWKNIAAVSASQNYSIGLKTNGKVVVTRNDYQYLCRDWTDIVSIAAGEFNFAGLKKDGTVEAEGNKDYGQCNVSDWKLIRL